jgi:predicted acetyltransferase
MGDVTVSMLSDVPDDLQAGPIRLAFEKTVRGNAARGLVPFYHFKMLDGTETIVGHVNLRIGDTRHVTMCAGQVGFGVIAKFRGHSYSYYACRALAPFIRLHYDRVILTADPDNVASRRVIEKLGASLIDEIDVPADDPAYLGGARRKCRYEWVP